METKAANSKRGSGATKIQGSPVPSFLTLEKDPAQSRAKDVALLSYKAAVSALSRSSSDQPEPVQKIRDDLGKYNIFTFNSLKKASYMSVARTGASGQYQMLHQSLFF